MINPNKPTVDIGDDITETAPIGITSFREQVVTNSLIEYHVLIDEKIGDVTGRFHKG